MVTDQIADTLTRIRNAQKAGHPAVSMPASKEKGRLLELLVSEGFIHSYEEAEDAAAKKVLKVFLKYQPNGTPAIKEIKRVSKPGRRVYVNKDEIPRNRGGLGLVVLSTSQGVISDSKARKLGIGGEIVCSVF